MNRLSFRMILFILVLSAVHMAGMAPLADSPEHRLQSQPATSRATPLPDHLQAHAHHATDTINADLLSFIKGNGG